MRLTRRKFVGGALGLSGALASGVLGYAGFIEPGELTVEHRRLRLPRLPEAFDGLKLALISDIHFGPYTREQEIAAAIEAVNGFSPDLVALTGDFVTEAFLGLSSAPARYMQDCSRLLTGLKAPLGRFAVLGNHDHATNPDYIAHTLEESGTQVLSNRHLPLERQGQRLWLAGLDDAVFHCCDFENALGGIPGGEAVILLAHEPDVADQSARFSVDLQLSGHTHGGQIRIPGLGLPWLPPLGEKYVMGLYQVGPSQLYISRGLGTVILPIRFRCPPEVTLFELHSAPQERTNTRNRAI